MNPILELFKVVDAEPKGSQAVRALVERMTEAELRPREIERTVDSLRKAFRDYLEECRVSPQAVWCSFCHKSQEEVEVLVVASTAAICDECTKISAEVIAERNAKKRERAGWLSAIVRRGK